jgi:hypothetical protein
MKTSTKKPADVPCLIKMGLATIAFIAFLVWAMDHFGLILPISVR